jgi:hypothetical protein
MQQPGQWITPAFHLSSAVEMRQGQKRLEESEILLSAWLCPLGGRSGQSQG